MSAMGGKRTLQIANLLGILLTVEIGRAPVLRPVIAFSTATMIALSGASVAQIPTCGAPFASLLGTSAFARYPAHVADRKTKPALPDVRNGQAHLYRTVLRDVARSGPNFAGHYTVVPIGCGAATSCLAIVDAITGRVYFPAALRSATSLLMDTGDFDPDRLNYRIDSRLLIVVGEPNEDEKRAGVSQYLWDAGKLKLVGFVSVAKLCK